MGTANFQVSVTADDVNAAFTEAVRRADAEFGHQQGYSGEINSKRSDGLRQVAVDAGADFQRFIDRVVDGEHPTIHADRYGPTLYIVRDVVSEETVQAVKSTEVKRLPNPPKPTLEYQYVVCQGSEQASGWRPEPGSHGYKHDAIAAAVDLAKRNGHPYRVERRLVESPVDLVAVVTPVRAEPKRVKTTKKKFTFFGLASC